MKEEGVALCHQVATLDRSKLVQKIGVLSPPLLKQVEEGLKAALGML
jgi:mRNA-degrading endonuclease toxin of MazEF toxin-antitoxin module